MVEEALFSWEGEWNVDRPYRAHARFSGLTLQSDGAFPGFRGINGQFDATEVGGVVSLSARDAHVELPRVFSEEVHAGLSRAQRRTGSSRRGTTLVSLKSVDVYQRAPGRQRVRLVPHRSRRRQRQRRSCGLACARRCARRCGATSRYRTPVTQAWLKRALLAGESRETRFRLQGPLKDFPFEDDKTGLFEVRTRVTGVTLDYADGWPPLTNADAEVVFRGRRMDVRPEAGSLLGLQLSGVAASIPVLGKREEHLLVKGAAEGPTAEFLRFVETSPVSRYINRFTEDMKAERRCPAGSRAGLAVAADRRLRDFRCDWYCATIR